MRSNRSKSESMRTKCVTHFDQSYKNWFYIRNQLTPRLKKGTEDFHFFDEKAHDFTYETNCKVLIDIAVLFVLICTFIGKKVRNFKKILGIFLFDKSVQTIFIVTLFGGF